jgi:hypothetical protein
MQVDHALVTGFGPGAPGVVVAVAYDHPATTIGDVFQVQAEDLTGPQPALQHEQHDRPVAAASQLLQQGLDVGVAHRPRNPLDRLDPDRAADRTLPAGAAHERAVSF